jgi:hypothetical protein
MVGGKANISVGNHKAFKSLKDVVLIGATARSPMGEAATSKGDHP